MSGRDWLRAIGVLLLCVTIACILTAAFGVTS